MSSYNDQESRPGQRWRTTGLLVLAALAAACGRRSELAFVTNNSSPFWTIARAGVRSAEKQFDVACDFHMPTEGPQHQKQILEDLVSRSVRGIAVSAIDPENQSELLDRIAEQVVLITHDSDAPKSKRRCFVGIDNYEAGRLCGDLVREALPEGGKIMLFIGRLESDNARRRRQGVIDAVLGLAPDPARATPADGAVSGGGWTILGTATDMGDIPRAKNNAEDALTKHPDLAAMVGLYSYNPPACLEALKQAGKQGKVKLIAFDEDTATLQGIRDGHVLGSIVQDPWTYGFESVRILVGLLRGDAAALPANGHLLVPARVIRKAEVEAFWADLDKKLAAGA
jgi:ribose transport system substrate-binding protein